MTQNRLEKDGSKTIFEIVPALKMRPKNYKERDIHHAQNQMRSAGYLAKGRNEANDIARPKVRRDSDADKPQLTLTSLSAESWAGSRKKSAVATEHPSSIKSTYVAMRRNSKVTPSPTSNKGPSPRASIIVQSGKGPSPRASIVIPSLSPRMRATSVDLRVDKVTDRTTTDRSSDSKAPSKNFLLRHSLDGDVGTKQSLDAAIGANRFKTNVRHNSFGKSISKQDHAAILEQIANRVPTSAVPRPSRSSFS